MTLLSAWAIVREANARTCVLFPNVPKIDPVRRYQSVSAAHQWDYRPGPPKPPAVAANRRSTRYGAWPAREAALVELTPEVLLKAYACGIFPMAESADDPGALLDRAGAARRHPARRVPCPRAPCPHRPHDALHRRLRPRLRRGDRRLRRAAAAAAPRTWINERIRALYRGLFASAIATPSRSMTATALVGGLYGVSLGARVLRREHVPSRARRLEGRAGASGRAAEGRRLPPPRHPVRHRSSQDLRRGRGAARAAITRMLEAALMRRGGLRGAAARLRGEPAREALRSRPARSALFSDERQVASAGGAVLRRLDAPAGGWCGAVARCRCGRGGGRAAVPAAGRRRSATWRRLCSR